MDFGVVISGDRAVALKFDEFPQQAHERLLARITDLTAQLLARVQSAEPALTSKLRSETVSSVVDSPERITGRVSITAEFGKAAALEYGAHGTTKVAQHVARVDHIFGRLVGPMTILVSQHTRRLNIAAHNFLRGPEAEISSEAITELRQALIDAVGAS